jgi:hypothetical protein
MKSSSLRKWRNKAAKAACNKRRRKAAMRGAIGESQQYRQWQRRSSMAVSLHIKQRNGVCWRKWHQIISDQQA